MEIVKIILSIFAVNNLLQPVSLQRYDPSLEVSSCTQSQVKLTIHGAADGGIVYIQGTGALCRQPTQSDVSIHVFDVNSCELKWRTTFRVIVQRNPLYQTGADKIFPVTCLPDTSDIIVGNRIVNVNVQDKKDEEEVTKSVTPTATMYLYRDGININGKTVELTDRLTMVIQLDNDYADDFDIEASECHADSIVTIRDGCPTDAFLFPKFTHDQGKLQSTFNVFRPTQLVGGIVNMDFTCSLQVCLGECTPKSCDDNVWAPAKYKRKLQVSNKKVDEILVGNSLLINTEDMTTKRAPSDLSLSHCKKDYTYIIVIVILVLLLVLTLLAFFCIRRQLTEERKLRRKDHTEQLL